MTTTKIQPSQIELLDWETNPTGQLQKQNYKNADAPARWQYSFPFWIDYGIEGDETAYPLRCDFSDVCEWATDKGIIEDFSIEPKEGWVLIPGTSEVRWSAEKQDAVETHRGRYWMNFEQFLRDYLTEKDLCKFIAHRLTISEPSEA